MNPRLWIEGLGVVGPGLPDWSHARGVLCGSMPYQPAPTAVPAATALPAAERRRAGVSIRLAIAVASAAVSQSLRDAGSLATVFTASGADGDNCHAICEALASDDRTLSPTRFHNSVHNAPAGYWTIAARSMAPSTTLCAHDASFAAGLMEAALQARSAPVLLVAYDTPYPSPIRETRPLPDAFGVACVLAPERTPQSLASMSISLVDDPADRCEPAALASLCSGVPAARALPWLAAIAQRRSGRVVLRYLDPPNLAIDIAPAA